MVKLLAQITLDQKRMTQLEAALTTSFNTHSEAASAKKKKALGVRIQEAYFKLKAIKSLEDGE